MIDLSALNEPALVYHYINVLPRHATNCLMHMSSHVSIYDLMTNRGKKRRKIYAPSRQLSWVQNQIRGELLLKVPVEDCVHGFVRERGTVTNALAHAYRRCRWIMNLDLRDFFPSITFPRVYGLYRAVFGFNDRVAAHLARLTTFDNHLCQGFCTSPDLANFIAWHLDKRLMALAKSLDIVYTRYADDLTFSAADDDVKAVRVKRLVTRIVADEGFEINEDKVAIMGVGRRQIVTGLVVSDHGVNLPRRTRRLLKAAVHHWRQQTWGRKCSIRGWISYLHAVDVHLAQRLLKAIDDAEADEGRTWSRDVSQGPFSFDISGGRQ